MPRFGPTEIRSYVAYLNAGITSRASRSSSFMMCACGHAGKEGPADQMRHADASTSFANLGITWSDCR